MEWDLVYSECRQVMANVIVAVAVLLAEATRQRREDAEARKWQQPAIGYFIEAMAIGVIAAQREPAEPLASAGLQSAVVTARTGTKLVDVTEALVEWLVECEGSKAAIAHRLIAIQLHLVRLIHGARAHIVHAQ